MTFYEGTCENTTNSSRLNLATEAVLGGLWRGGMATATAMIKATNTLATAGDDDGDLRHDGAAGIDEDDGRNIVARSVLVVALTSTKTIVATWS